MCMNNEYSTFLFGSIQILIHSEKIILEERTTPSGVKRLHIEY